ncbi:carbamoyltransferase C-terminal domain-containing protein [Pseudomonas syringae]|uniref:carbamoyltransferase C-terminal domain-containing protein n=1 Tax=Pseudomonas syringae TaxID=317 RepID=UPI0007604BA9|nr:carbamoyltransferase C-terminal domain-containing protein [Pseudomonas syringae]KWS28942.1 proline dehydrogenase [Pseudomonas syringae pv. syringae]
MMKIVAVKPGHDGHITYVKDGTLEFSYEAEKDTGFRYQELDIITTIDAFMQIGDVPDVISVSGWSRGWDPMGVPVGAGYSGLQVPEQKMISFMGTQTALFSSTHERSHLFCAYAMSPYDQGEPVYALLWEGHLGAFYSIDANVNITKLKDILVDPGIRYAFIYALVDPTFNLPRGGVRLGDAGKLMALAAYCDSSIVPSAEETAILDKIFSAPQEKTSLHKEDFNEYEAFNSGVASEASKRLARLASNKLFEIFHSSISELVEDIRPLLITGGCGLNCDWNAEWQACELFADTFIPPCTNDTGAGLGTAAEAQFLYTGDAKIKWSVYSGQDFVDDLRICDFSMIDNYIRIKSGVAGVASALNKGAVIAWVNGKCEIGPRALGNRSLLAEPFHRDKLNKLNEIKKREMFRPIAPICLEDDYQKYFTLTKPSPHMLYFSQVKDARLRAVSHVDGSARPQTVNEKQNPEIFELLLKFRETSGVGVLCNTSLNFNRMGFINRSSDLLDYAKSVGLDGFVLNGTAFMREEFLDDC